jgi:hypothetical protein
MQMQLVGPGQSQNISCQSYLRLLENDANSNLIIDKYFLLNPIFDFA